MSTPTRRPAVSLGRALLQLYRKDVQSLQFTLVLFSVMIALWDVYLLTRVKLWAPGMAFGLSFIPLTFIPLWVIWDAIQSYRSEWHSGTIYFMFSAPVPGWLQVLSKLAAVMTSFTVQSALAFTGTWVLFGAARPYLAGAEEVLSQVPGGYLARLVGAALAVYWLSGLATVLGFQAAYVASQLASRWQFPTLLAALAVEQWLAFRIGGLGHYLFAWVPDLAVTGFVRGPDGIHGLPELVVIDSGPLLGWALTGVLLFFTTAWLLQDVVEVS